MYKLSIKLSLLAIAPNNVLSPKNIAPLLPNYIQTRNTFILKRKYPVKLYKKGVDRVRLKGKDHIYELVEDTNIIKKPNVQVILKQFVEDVGQRGEVVTVKRRFAYNKLLLPGLADYATEDALDKAKVENANITEAESISSLSAVQAVKYLKSQVLAVVMNKEKNWTIQPWHLRVSFRKAGVHVPQHCISLPPNPISGPDLSLEGKEFCVVVTINNKEKVKVRCRIHHWSTNVSDRLPDLHNHWQLPSEAIFPEDIENLKELNLNTKRMVEISNAKKQ